MVGGVVIGVSLRLEENAVLLNVQGAGCERNDTTHVRCKRHRTIAGRWIEPSVGDYVWWQGRVVYWSTASGGLNDVPLERLYQPPNAAERQE